MREGQGVAAGSRITDVLCLAVGAGLAVAAVKLGGGATALVFPAVERAFTDVFGLDAASTGDLRLSCVRPVWVHGR